MFRPELCARCELSLTLIIERDGGQGDAADTRVTNPAGLKKVFRIELERTDANGNLVKEEVVELMNI